MPSGNEPATKPSGFRISAILVLVFVLVYTAAVISGLLPKEKRIDASTLGVIGIGGLISIVLFRPDIIDRVTRMEIAGWKFEIEKKQAKQDKQLKDIQLILPILLGENERKHLLNVAAQNKKPITGSHDLRTELRRLRSLKLVQIKGDQKVADIAADGKTVDISESAVLTELGKHWADRIKEIEEEAAKAADPPAPLAAG